ncbi:MAG: peptidoglycan-binding protein [Acidimicrobiia bacterium]
MENDTPLSISNLQARLLKLGYDISETEIGKLGIDTETALRSYQEIHGLPITGIFDEETWNELNLNTFKLGDRLLYERQPMFRGDDVAQLQHRLNSLGFDSGREDGIFRAETAQALREFQRNMAISSDGICGPNTVIALERVSTFASSSATSLREKIKWQSRDETSSYRVGLNIDPTFTIVGDRLIKELFDMGLKIPLYHEGANESDVAIEANRNGIDFLFSIIPSFAAAGRCVFFSNSRYRSMVGASFAGAIQHELSKILKSDPDEIVGRMYPLLQESKMPCVIIELCDTSDITMVKLVRERSVDIAKAIATAIQTVIKYSE